MLPIFAKQVCSFLLNMYWGMHPECSHSKTGIEFLDQHFVRAGLACTQEEMCPFSPKQISAFTQEEMLPFLAHILAVCPFLDKHIFGLPAFQPPKFFVGGGNLTLLIRCHMFPCE